MAERLSPGDAKVRAEELKMWATKDRQGSHLCNSTCQLSVEIVTFE